MNSTHVLLCVGILTTLGMCISAGYNIHLLRQEMKHVRNSHTQLEDELSRIFLLQDDLTNEDDIMHVSKSCDECWYKFTHTLDGSEHCSKYPRLSLSEARKEQKCDSN